MNNTAQQQQRLLIVDDSKVVRVTARKILGNHFETVEALDGENAWDILTSEAPFSLVISDLSMPNLDGFELLERIRNSHLSHISDVPVIIITGANDSASIKERATQTGATDFIGKPFDSVHLLARAQAHASAHNNARTLKEETIALEDESVIDPLTKIANEMAFMERGYQQLAYAVRHNTKLSVFRIEVDDFGDLYKTHGESAAESIVQTVASVLTANIRLEDTAARIGTARFAILLPGLNNNGINNLATRIMQSISERVLKHENSHINYTVSIGVAATEICRDTRFDDLLSVANNRLVYAISHGGNQVVYDGEDYPETPTSPELEISTLNTPELENEIEIPTEIMSLQSNVETQKIPVPSDEMMLANAIESTPVEQGSSTALYVPDLSLTSENSGAGTVSPLPEQTRTSETIEITAVTDAYQPFETGMPDVAAKQAPAVNDKPDIQTADVRTTRVRLLERILTWVQPLFRKTRKPK